jgi:putative addiction module killer protein
VSGVYEFRIHLGPGYRIYFGKAKDRVVIILCAGDKRSQERDINKAKKYWQLYKEALKEDKNRG